VDAWKNGLHGGMVMDGMSAACELNHLPALDAASFALVSFINPRVDLQKFYEAE
jgi:hypothetical protein